MCASSSHPAVKPHSSIKGPCTVAMISAQCSSTGFVLCHPLALLVYPRALGPGLVPMPCFVDFVQHCISLQHCLATVCRGSQ